MILHNNNFLRCADGAKHLDVGCGATPRNPFNAPNLFGIDVALRKDANLVDMQFVIADLIIEKIPFPDNFFDSISAYDFLEHIPRLLYKENGIDYPFVRLMSEVYRVLKPNGIFYAITPVYPKESAFVDPTHVNFISKNTYKYFSEPHVWSRMYGFEGSYTVKRVEIVNFDYEVNPRKGLRKLIKWALCTLNPYSKQHIVWHFHALKFNESYQ